MVDRDLLYVGQLCVGKMYIFFHSYEKKEIYCKILVYQTNNKCVMVENRALFSKSTYKTKSQSH